MQVKKTLKIQHIHIKITLGSFIWGLGILFYN